MGEEETLGESSFGLDIRDGSIQLDGSGDELPEWAV